MATTTTTSKHTGGPWTDETGRTVVASTRMFTYNGDDIAGLRAIADQFGRRVCYVLGFYDARLIAAAPDLLAGCLAHESLTEYETGQCGKCGAEAPSVLLTGDSFDHIDGPLCEECVGEMIQAAIANATGTERGKCAPIN